MALRLAGTLRPAGARLVVEAELDSAAAAERLRVNLFDVFGHRAQVGTLARSPAHGRCARRWVVRVADSAQLLARQAGFLDAAGYPVRDLVPPAVAGGVCDAEAVWRGALLARGSLAWKGDTRTLQVRSPDAEASLVLVGAARRLGYAARTDQLPDNDQVVMADQDTISALLARLGAPVAAQVWTTRQVRGPDPEGRLGFHAANRERAATAAAATAARVAQALQILTDVEVPAHLTAAGRLRLAHPEASLEALAALADPPLTKSTMVGRIRRLLALADEHRGQ